MNRRSFMESVGAGVAGSALAGRPASAAGTSPADRVSVAIMGVRGRGSSLTSIFASLPDVEIPYLCDVDSTVVGPAVKFVQDAKGKAPRVVDDIRRVLDDKSVHAIVVATPVHWHAPATILACEAGKDVYVEKPMSHNVREGRLAVQAARRNNRVVQVGSQSRSRPHTYRMMEFIRSGKIGDVLMARVENTEMRPNLGQKPDEPVPAGLNYDLWVGPAPMVPFNRNRFHRTYAWNWSFGAAELGDNGSHWLDICRWALGVEAPTAISGAGRKLFFNDDRQTPDTDHIIYDYDKKAIVWNERLWTPYGYQKSENTMIFYGTQGTVEMGRWAGGRYAFRAFDSKGELIHHEDTDEEGSTPHIRNFIDCVRTRNKPNADVEIGHISATLCHLGNIVARTGRNIRFDPVKETILNDAEASKLLTREYRDHWSSKLLRGA